MFESPGLCTLLLFILFEEKDALVLHPFRTARRTRKKGMNFWRWRIAVPAFSTPIPKIIDTKKTAMQIAMMIFLCLLDRGLYLTR